MILRQEIDDDHRRQLVAAGIVDAIGKIDRFNSPQKLVSYFGLNPRVRQSGLGAAHHGSG
jgi:transposase